MSEKTYSIRRRLVGGTLILMIVIFGGISIAARELAIHESKELFSARLATSARVLEALVARQLEKASVANPIIIALPKQLEEPQGDAPEEFGHPYETKIAFQVWRDGGPLLAKSASAPDIPLGTLKAGFGTNKIDDDLWQLFALRSGDVWIITAEKDEVRQEMANGIGLSILLPLVLGGLLMLIAVNVVLTINMRSLRELADRIGKREPESLALIHLDRTPDELAPIVTELNSLLTRVKATFEREQRFINAAAHEIRTPIAALQLHVENAQRANTAEEREKSLNDAMQGVRRTAKLAEQLLVLSRIAAKGAKENFQPVLLSQVSCEVIAVHEPLLTRRGQVIGLDVDGEVAVWGEPYKLQRLLQNLIENASQYGKKDGEIQVDIRQSPEGMVWSISNDGPPIPDEEMKNIFMPYYRILGTDAPGSGLGLAIVNEIVEQHHAHIEMRRKADGQGNVATVMFKCMSAPTAA
ncbi:ATP-binding protein [Herminiimonas aquatilis]|uniref:histidine kinase n=1 Tax=Herminiimonas aquatilis TaxID=345342 RepID=A0ABW2J273_9BURK